MADFPTDESRRPTKKRKKQPGKSEETKAFEKELTDTSRKALKEFRSLYVSGLVI